MSGHGIQNIPTSGRYLDNAPNMAERGYLLYTKEESMSPHRQTMTYYQHPDRWEYILRHLAEGYVEHARVLEIWLENENDAADQVLLWRRK